MCSIPPFSSNLYLLFILMFFFFFVPFATASVTWLKVGETQEDKTKTISKLVEKRKKKYDGTRCQYMLEPVYIVKKEERNLYV